jgi:predicted CoA-substrate-specific enzyme activase
MVAVTDGQITATARADNTFDPVAVGRRMLDGIRYDRLTATGYGRHIFREHFDCEVISEISAFALGVKRLFPVCRAILDIGGQDTKVSYLSPEGRVLKFEMNDKCAAGTGRFLEIMAGALNYKIDEFGDAALSAGTATKISSMCTVFAESEVISLLHRGIRREEVALGIHEAITRRVTSMIGRLPGFNSLIFAGGVARNTCICQLLEKNTEVPVLVPDERRSSALSEPP